MLRMDYFFIDIEKCHQIQLIKHAHKLHEHTSDISFRY